MMKVPQDKQGVHELRGFKPQFGKDCYLAPTAVVIGDVVVGAGCSIWFHTVLRGDVMPIRVGNQCNLQDGVIVHGTFNRASVTLGDRVTVGHAAVLHGCDVSDEVLIGMGSILMDGVKVGKHSLIGAGSLISEGTLIPPRSLVLGRPGRVVRQLRDDEVEQLHQSADNYLTYKTWYSGL